MPDEINPNSAMPQAPVEGVSPVSLAPQAPAVQDPVVAPATNEGIVTPPVDASPQVPQSQDKSDAMTYPLGSQDSQPGVSPATSVAEEDHRTILDRIMGIFNKGKKVQPESSQPASVDQTPTGPTPPIQ